MSVPINIEKSLIILKLSTAPFIISALLLGSYLHKKKDGSNIHTRRTILGGSGIFFFLNVLLLNYAYQLLDPKHNTPPSSFFFTLTNTFQTFTLDLNYEDVAESLAVITNHATGWKIYIGFILLLAPIAFGGTVITILASFLPEMKATILFFFAKLIKNRIYIFSRLNEQSLTYAEQIIRTSDFNPIFAFCNCKEESEDYDSLNLQSRALNEGCFCFKQDMSSIYLNNRFPWIYQVACWGSKRGWKIADVIRKHFGRNVRYYFMHHDDLVNTNEAVYIATKGALCWMKCDSVEVITFSQNEITKDTLESIWKKEKMPKVRIIPYITNTIYNTLLKNPLFLDIEQNTLDIAIVGDNIWAIEIFKTLLWYGQFEGVALSLQCYSDDEVEYDRILHSIVTDLDNFSSCNSNSKNEPYCKYSFHSEDSLETGSAQFWFICKDSDVENMEIAHRLSQQATNSTKIFYCIKSGSLAEGFRYRHEELSANGCEMHIFGTEAECYSPETVEGKIMNLAEKIDKVWNNPGDHFSDDEYKRRSSLAAALHVPYKLYALNLLDETKVKALCESNNFLGDIKECLMKLDDKTQKKHSVRIARMEHIRWMAYMRSIGYRKWEESDFKKLQNGPKLDTKDHVHRLHLALVPYDKLNLNYSWVSQ